MNDRIKMGLTVAVIVAVVTSYTVNAVRDHQAEEAAQAAANWAAKSRVLSWDNNTPDPMALFIACVKYGVGLRRSGMDRDQAMTEGVRLIKMRDFGDSRSSDCESYVDLGWAYEAQYPGRLNINP